MAAEKVRILITSHTKVGGKHIDRGTVMDIDPDVADDRNNYALLVHAGRVAKASPENIAKLKAEMAAEEAFEKRQAESAKASAPPSIADIVAAVVTAMKQSSGSAEKGKA